MFVLGNLAEGVEDVVDPKHRVVQFGDSGPQRTVVRLVRHTWTSKVPDEHVQAVGAAEAFRHWVENDWKQSRAYTEETSVHDDGAGLERNPDNDDVQTEWRKCLLQDSHESWVIDYPAAGESGHSPIPSVFQRWSHNVLIVPAFIDKNLKVSASRVIETEAEPPTPGQQLEGSLQKVVNVDMGYFGKGKEWEAWFIKRGVQVKFELAVETTGGDDDKLASRSGVAAVFAVGPLCTDSHGEPCCDDHED